MTRLERYEQKLDDLQHKRNILRQRGKYVEIMLIEKEISKVKQLIDVEKNNKRSLYCSSLAGRRYKKADWWL